MAKSGPKKSYLYSEDDGPVLLVVKDDVSVVMDSPLGDEITLATKPFPGNISNTTPSASALCEGIWIMCVVADGKCHCLNLTTEDMITVESDWEELCLTDVPNREACPTDIRGIISLSQRQILFIGTDAAGNNAAAIIDFTTRAFEIRAVRPPVYKYIEPKLIRHNEAVIVWEGTPVREPDQDPEILSLAADAPIPTKLLLPMSTDIMKISLLSDGTYVCLLAGNIVSLWNGAQWNLVPVNIQEGAFAEIFPGRYPYSFGVMHSTTPIWGGKPVSTKCVMIDPYNMKVTGANPLASRMLQELEPLTGLDLSKVINLE